MYITADPQHLREFVDLCEVLPYWYNILSAAIAVPDWKVSVKHFPNIFNNCFRLDDFLQLK